MIERTKLVSLHRLTSFWCPPILFPIESAFFLFFIFFYFFYFLWIHWKCLWSLSSFLLTWNWLYASWRRHKISSNRRLIFKFITYSILQTFSPPIFRILIWFLHYSIWIIIFILLLNLELGMVFISFKKFAYINSMTPLKR